MDEKKEATPRSKGDGHKTKDGNHYTNSALDSQQISVFRGISPEPTRQIEWQEAIEEIRSGKYQKQIEQLRQILGTEAYKEAKKKLPGVTFGGLFSYRNKDGVEDPTGFIVADIDHITDIDQTHGMLSQDENVWFAFKSPGGDGIKCGLRAENIRTDAEHKQFYHAVERYFKDVYEITIDPSCKDISRLTYLSYDPDAFINPDPYIFNIDAWTLEANPTQLTLPQIPTNGDSKEKYARKVLESACQKIRDSAPGAKHSTRLKEARLVGGYLHYGITDAEALEALETAVAASGTVNIDNAMKTIRDGIEHGKLSPVTIPEPAKSNDDFEAEVKELLNLGVVEREQKRSEIAKKYDVRKSIIDTYLKGLEYEQKTETDTQIVVLADPWDSVVDGDRLLCEINNLLKSHVVLPEKTSEAIATWTLLTYCYDAYRILPILGVVSPEKRCGKTTLLEAEQGLCNKALLASNISPSAVYRTIEKHHPTLLIDEADSFLKDNEELRGVLNSGHTRQAAYVIRTECINNEFIPVKFSTWAPKAVAMIGELPGTIHDRSIIVRLRRKTKNEKTRKLGLDFENKNLDLRRKCQRWANDNFEKLKHARPTIPDTGNDREADNWTPLLCIADVVGGQWPGLLRDAMVSGTESEDTITTQLLCDIKDILSEHQGDAIFSETLIERLKAIEDHPWVDWSRGKGLSQTALSKLLKPFKIFPANQRIGGLQKKGYKKEWFKDTFERYVLHYPPIRTVPPSQANNDKAFDVFQTVPSNSCGTDEKRPKGSPTKAGDVGTDGKPLWSRNKEEVI